jgi:hypothetical protein
MGKNLGYIEIKNDNVVMGKTLYNKLNEVNYFAWVIGFEVLDFVKQDVIYLDNKLKICECDSLYDFCNYVANNYINSEEYKNTKYSGYEMLYEYINNNGGILKIYKDYFRLQNM